MISVRDLIGWEWDLRLHKGSFLLGLAAGAAAGVAVVAAIHARQQRTRQREEGRI
jgi:hypothetical protein